MKVDIWSDVRCPFCYIGKRKFEQALEQFDHKENIEVVWHSFQLDANTVSMPGKSIYEYLAEKKGMSVEQSKQMHAQVTASAAEVGLEFNFDKTVISNTFDAHRLIQLAKRHHLGDAAEEVLFKAYFTDGKDVSNHDTLINLFTSIGLDREEVVHVLTTEVFSDDVHRDEAQAVQLGVRGVPFFVLNDKYGVSGAQPSELFLQALQQSYSEYNASRLPLDFSTAIAGDACDVNGNC
ncbi:putative DsbA family dithiol-disulfide isomerase [Chitinophaga skermanii]|uniref:Putative DsbA family dithiol-disulfide isomerase n=1 Tax=Chitinophaga skermanii TaxID=331697 RepID=A0A327QV55_9BACT|nr:DsbA family oxidoreductase [Chitinophaga skermanii]RAJ08566.1 putative DsbA family dithiol-disulfide isomerase [Chitinophaga skermanii]